MRPGAYNFIKKETPAQVFSCEICKIFKNTYFKEHLRTTNGFRTASDIAHTRIRGSAKSLFWLFLKSIPAVKTTTPRCFCVFLRTLNRFFFVPRLPHNKNCFFFKKISTCPKSFATSHVLKDLQLPLQVVIIWKSFENCEFIV